jgi:predicted small metal-binding protein
MIRFICKDLGFDCDFIATGENRTDIMQAAMLHAITEHGKTTSKFSMEQSVEYLFALEAAVKQEVVG